MRHPEWEFLDHLMTYHHLGYIPFFLDIDDPRPAKEQINEHYVGGWHPRLTEWTMDEEQALHYPDDPGLQPLARTRLRDETVLFYRHSWVAILQPDGSFEVDRLD